MQLTTSFVILHYFCASTSLLILNKLSLNNFRFPYTLTSLQLLIFCFITVSIELYFIIFTGNGKYGLFKNPSVSRAFLIPGFLWGLPLAFNMQTLAYLNPETVLIFRAATIFGVAAGDRLVFRTNLEWHQYIAMFFTFLGALIYTHSNIIFSIEGYLFGILYWGSFILSQLLTKSAFSASSNVSVMCKAFYVNLYGSVPAIWLGIIFEGFPALNIYKLDNKSILPILASLVVGIILSYFGNYVRDILSATSFDVLGCAGKFITIFVSSLVFPVQYNFGMILGLLLAICSSMFYAPAFFAFITWQMGQNYQKSFRTSRFRLSKYFIVVFTLFCTLLCVYMNENNFVFDRDISQDSKVEFKEIADKWFKEQRGYDKFILLHAGGGFGNVFHSVSSTFVLAILTERALVIDWDGCTLDMFGSPFVELCINERRKVDHNFKRIYDRAEKASKVDKLKATVCLKVRCYASKEYARNTKEMIFGHFPDIARYDFNNRWPQNLVHIKSETYFVGFLFLNDLYLPRLKKYQKTDDYLYPKILTYLFKPVPRIQNMIDEFSAQKLDRGECISVFARTTGFHGSIKNNKHLFRSLEDYSKLLGPQYYDCAQKYFRREMIKNTTIFVASLYTEVKEYFKERYENVVYFAKEAGEQSNNDLAVIDLYLLAQCRYAIYSYGSTFGQVSRSLSKSPQRMYQTLSPTLLDGVTPIIDGIEQTLYRVEGDCKIIQSREGCSAAWVRWKNRNLTTNFYKVSGVASKFPKTFEHGNSC